VISPYARRGCIDHQTLSFDAFNKFIEDDFLSGQRLNPKTDGRPDPRPDVRESLPVLGNLVNDFNFAQRPRPPMLLPVDPRPGPASSLGAGALASPCGSNLTVAVTPRIISAGQRATVRLFVRAGGEPVAWARVTVGHHHVRTGRAGHAAVTVDASVGARSISVIAARSGLQATARVVVRR
jgi:hypothetical protein